LLRQQACEAVNSLNNAGIQPIVLKGGLHFFGSRFDRAGRIMADLDFLVPRSKLRDYRLCLVAGRLLLLSLGHTS
jgi:hypothetical protein